MNGKLTISNRTWIIIAAAVLAVIILVAVIKPSEKSGDLSLESYDGKATLTISDVSLGNVDMGDRHLARCKIDRSKDFFKSAVVKHDDFLGSLGMGGDFYPASEKKDTGKALFLTKGHYFTVIYEKGYALIEELTATITTEKDVYYFPFPCATEFTYGATGMVDFESLESVSDYESLVEFYRRLDSDLTRIESQYKNVHVRLTQNGELTEMRVVLHETPDGIQVYVDEKSAK